MAATIQNFLNMSSEMWKDMCDVMRGADGRGTANKPQKTQECHLDIWRKAMSIRGLSLFV